MNAQRMLERRWQESKTISDVKKGPIKLPRYNGKAESITSLIRC